MRTLRLHQWSVVGGFILQLISFSTVSAQTTEDLRARAAAREREIAQAATVFLDRGRSEADRASAVAGVASFIRPEHLLAAVRIVLDSTQPAPIRVLAVSRGIRGFQLDSALFSRTLQTLASDRTPLPVRVAILEVVENAMMGSPLLHSHEEQIKASLAASSYSSSRDLRPRAIKLLVRFKPY